METLPVDLVEVVGAIMGSLLVLIPVLGLAVRFAARPLVDALVREQGRRRPSRGHRGARRFGSRRWSTR